MINPATAIAALAAAALISSTAAAQSFGLKPDRTAEDWSHLRDASKRATAAAYKFIPLTDDGSAYLSLGGDVRERVEIFDAPRFGLGGAQKDTYLLQRILIHGDLHLGSAARVFAQLGAHEAWDKTLLSAPDEDHLDVHQLFVELFPAGEALSLRVGRQEMAFNPAQRFVSFRDGTNVRQNFDGARLTYRDGPFRLDGFLTRPVVLERGVFDDEPNDDVLFGGLYASHRVGGDKGGTVDAYWFYLDRQNGQFGSVVGDERRHSIGVRLAGARDGWDWDAETLAQFGRHAGRDIAAWGVGADFGYTFAASMKPRLGLRFDAGSGDGDAGDDKLGSFNPLFPKGPYFNEANLTSFTNLVALRPSVKLQPTAKLSLEGAVQQKWREDRDDAVYLGPFAPLAQTRSNRAREIGQVYTLDANWQMNAHLSLRAYYLHHSAGDAIERAGGKSIDFAMASAQLKF